MIEKKSMFLVRSIKIVVFKCLNEYKFAFKAFSHYLLFHKPDPSICYDVQVSWPGVVCLESKSGSSLASWHCH